MAVFHPIFGQPTFWYGQRPLGTSGGAPPPATGTTGFRHPYYLHRGQPVRYGFNVQGTSSGGSPGTGTTGFRHPYYLFYGQPVRYLPIIKGTGGAGVVPPEPTPTPEPTPGGGAGSIGGGGSWLYREAYNELRRAIRAARAHSRGLTRRKKRALEEAARLAAQALELIDAEQEVQTLHRLAELLEAATNSQQRTIQEAHAAIEYAEGVLDDEEVIELLMLH